MFYTAPRPPNLKNLGLPWKPQELRRLEDLVNAGLHAPRIALIMGRSTVAIRAKTASMGWHLRRKGDPGTDLASGWPPAPELPSPGTEPPLRSWPS